MAQSSIDNDLKSIGKLCLELCQTSVAIGHEVKLSMNIGSTFSFNYSSENNGSPLPAAVEKEKPKKKSRATLQRDRQRRAAFLLKKAGSSEIGPPLAVERPLLEPPEVTNGYVETILSPSSPSSETRSSDPESNDLEDNPDSPVTLLATKEGTINTFCICSSVPCVCLASKPLSPINHQPVHYGLSNVIIRDQKFAKVSKSKPLLLAYFWTKRAQFFFKRSKTSKILRQIFFQIFLHWKNVKILAVFYL